MTMDSIKIYCTDKEQYVDGTMFAYNRGKFLEAVVNTVKIRMPFHGNGKYIGSMAGLEFVVRESDIPQPTSEPRRRR